MGSNRGPKIVTNGLVLALDAANKRSYPGTATIWSNGWSGAYVNPTYSFDGNLSTYTIQTGTATYTFAGAGLNVTGTVRIYVTFGATSGQVAGLPNVVVVDGTDVSSKMAAANLYAGGAGAGWIDVTSEVGAVFNTIVMTGTSSRSNPAIYAVEVNGQILIDGIGFSPWKDLSGNNNTGTLTNGPTYSANNLGNIVFDGTNDYASLPAINPTASAFSCETFFQWASIGSDKNTLFSLCYEYPNKGYLIRQSDAIVTDGKVVIWSDNGSESYVRSSQILSVNTWYHLVVVQSSNTCLIYINGVLDSSQALSNPVLGTSSNTFIGARSGTGAYLNGKVAVSRIYNKALSATEVLQNYNATKRRYGL